MIDSSFIAHASIILADTETGLSSSEICKLCNAYATKYRKSIRHTDTNSKFPKKSEVLRKNLECFEPEQQFAIINELCDLKKFKGNDQVAELKAQLIKDYARYAPLNLPTDFLERTQQLRHWLDDYPESKAQYESALEKKTVTLYERNLVDDLRLSFELLVKQVLKTKKSLENTKSELGNYLKTRSINIEISNLYVGIIFDFFTKYQDENIKHNDRLNPIEVDFIFNQTTTLMLFLISLDKQNF